MSASVRSRAVRLGEQSRSRSGSRVQELDRRGWIWRPQYRGGVCSPRKRERAGATPSHWLSLPQITRSLAAGSAARQQRRGGAGRETTQAGPPFALLPRPRVRLALGEEEGGREILEEARRWPNVSQESSVLRGVDPAKTQRLLSTVLCVHSLPIQFLLSTEAIVISLKCKSDYSSKTQSSRGVQRSAESKIFCPIVPSYPMFLPALQSYTEFPTPTMLSHVFLPLYMLGPFCFGRPSSKLNLRELCGSQVIRPLHFHCQSKGVQSLVGEQADWCGQPPQPKTKTKTP